MIMRLKKFKKNKKSNAKQISVTFQPSEFYQAVACEA